MYLLPEIDGAETEEAQRTTSVVNTIRVKLLMIICMQLLACMKMGCLQRGTLRLCMSGAAQWVSEIACLPEVGDSMPIYRGGGS